MSNRVLEEEPFAVDLSVTGSTLTVALGDGRSLSVPLAWYPRLARATEAERADWQLFGGGYAIEWPELDEHIGVAGLLAGQLIPLDASLVSAGFRRLDPQTDEFGKRWSSRMTSLHRGTEPGQTLSFRFKGTRCAIYDIIGPDCGQVMVTLDDQAPRLVPRFDAYCTYHRLATLLVGELVPDSGQGK